MRVCVPSPLRQGWVACSTSPSLPLFIWDLLFLHRTLWTQGQRRELPIPRRTSQCRASRETWLQVGFGIEHMLTMEALKYVKLEAYIGIYKLYSNHSCSLELGLKQNIFFWVGIFVTNIVSNRSTEDRWKQIASQRGLLVFLNSPVCSGSWALRWDRSKPISAERRPGQSPRAEDRVGGPTQGRLAGSPLLVRRFAEAQGSWQEGLSQPPAPPPGHAETHPSLAHPLRTGLLTTRSFYGFSKDPREGPGPAP